MAYLGLVFNLCCALAALLGPILVVFCLVPGVSAISPTQSFPNISFHDFANFISSTFSDDISLPTVLVLLFTLTENPEFLNLQGRRKFSKLADDDKISAVTPWMAMLARLLLGVRLPDTRDELFRPEDSIHFGSGVSYTTQSVNSLSKKLDSMILLLDLNTYQANGTLRHRRKPISYDMIEPIHLICPQAYQCEMEGCAPYSLALTTQYSQVPRVNLLKAGRVHAFAFVLAGNCNHCKSTYYADHDRFRSQDDGEWKNSYLNSAAYLKLGQSTWADRSFTKYVIQFSLLYLYILIDNSKDLF